MPFQFDEFPHTRNYDDDLREMLALIETFNSDYTKLVEGFEELQNNFDSLSGDFTRLENEFKNVLIEFSKFEDQVKQIIVSLDDKQKQIDELHEMYEELYSLYNSFLRTVDTIVDAKINLYDSKNKEYINNLISPIYAQLKDIWEQLNEKEAWTMYNRLAGKRDKTVNVINDYYEGLRVHCITVSEYGEMNLTVNEFSSHNLTTRQYATMSRDMLNRYFMFKFINPFTGLKNSVNNIFSWIATNMIKATTINNYDANEHTVEEYDNMNLTVTDYYELYPDSFGYVATGGNGLTTQEYGQLRLI